MYTEEEAKSKWCPMSRNIFYQSLCEPYGYAAAINRAEGEDNRCIGSLCMLWRWADYTSQIIDGKSLLIPKTKAGGYCGLGDKP